MKLSSRERKRLPSNDFALPGRRYPIEDKAHARNAIARVDRFGTKREQQIVRAKVKAKFPSIKQGRMRA